MELLLPARLSHHHDYLFCPWWNKQTVQRAQKLHPITLLNWTFLRCLWDLGAWTQVRCFGEMTSCLADFFEGLHFQGKKFYSLQALIWYGKMYVQKRWTSTMVKCISKKTPQEPSFSRVWGYWNLVFVSEAIWEWSHNQSPQNIISADKSLNEHLDHSGGS